MTTPDAAISDFRKFLETMGLTCLRDEAPPNSMSYKLIEYSGAVLRVRFTYEKGFWDIRLAEDASVADAWYDAKLFTYIFEKKGIPNLPLEAQIKYLEAHWPQILTAFNSTNRSNTCVRLQAAKMERARQVFMIWPSAVKDFGVFLKEKGLPCIERKEAEVLYGPMRVQYANSQIAVRISSSGGWHVDFASALDSPREWQSFRSIRRLIQWPKDMSMSFNEMFEFIKENWETIADAFSPPNVQKTLSRLVEIEAGSVDKG